MNNESELSVEIGGDVCLEAGERLIASDPYVLSKLAFMLAENGLEVEERKRPAPEGSWPLAEIVSEVLFTVNQVALSALGSLIAAWCVQHWNDRTTAVVNQKRIDSAKDLPRAINVAIEAGGRTVHVKLDLKA